MEKINIAILGPGKIARQMAKTVTQMDSVHPYAVASRDAGRAKSFADEFGFEKAYGSYEEMAQDPGVDLVYIATPHSHHYEHAKLCLENGRHVLCEKAFTANARQAEKLLALAEKKKLLAAEAIWTRYMPMSATLNEITASGVIGTVTSLTANLGYVIAGVPRITDPALAGGALLDVGVYPINFALMAFGTDIERIVSGAVKGETGVDLQNSVTLFYRNGRMAVLNSSALAQTDRRGIISGSRGYILVENINNPEKISVFDLDRKETAAYSAPAQITGYEYEVEAAVQAIREGRTECPQMPRSEIIRVMKLMDSLREDWNIRYPFE